MLNERDEHHARCVDQAKTIHGPFYTSWPVITEAAHLLKKHASAVQNLLAWVRTSEIQILQLSSEDAEGIAQILSRYSDQRFDFADATLMYLADRDNLTTVFTIDHRHFSVYRPKLSGSLSLVPGLG
jgi:predicted nucleic acid-binding protein